MSVRGEGSAFVSVVIRELDPAYRVTRTGSLENE